MARFVAALALLCTLAPSAPSAAQDAGAPSCDDPLVRRPRLTFPANGARGVTLDAPLRVRYTEGYFGPSGPGGDPTTLLTVERCAGGCTGVGACDDVSAREFVPGLVQRIGDELVFFPDGGWSANTAYTGIARGRDEDRTFQFCTGTSLDDTAPTFGRLADVTSSTATVSCDAPDGGYRIAVFFPPATDFGPPASIEYLLYQTRGTGIDGPVVRDREPNFATDQITLAFNLPPEEATAPICVRVAAVDGVGNVTFNETDADGDCVDPVQGNFFYPLCAIGAPGHGSRSGAGVLALVALVALALRRRR